MRHRSFIVVFLSMLSIGTISAKPGDLADLKQQVIDTERAFAQTMAKRDFNAFSTFLSAEAVFFTRTKPLHGRQEVMNAWN
jgi:ketosteroid isomerase-like protein